NFIQNMEKNCQKMGSSYHYSLPKSRCISASGSNAQTATVNSVQGNLQKWNVQTGMEPSTINGESIGVGDILSTGSDSNTDIHLTKNDVDMYFLKNTAAAYVPVRIDPSTGLGTILPVSGSTYAYNYWKGNICDVECGNVGVDDEGLGPLGPILGGLTGSSLIGSISDPIPGAPDSVNNVLDAIEFYKGFMEWVHSGSVTDNPPYKSVTNNPNAQRDTGFIITPLLLIIPHGTDFTINVDADGKTTVQAFQGVVDVYDRLNNNSMTEINPHQVLTRSPTQQIATSSFDQNSVDRWWLNSASAIPEFGSMVYPMFAITILAIIVLSVKIRSVSK
ncbi:MAG: hypothetical protein KGL95_06285, partial [Patescibacteria group bacterium]|nr:hypothetical protein [Patescibacteria group bacterium]